MPKKKEPPETLEDQGERFRSEVERLIAAGELNPTDADAAMERTMGGVKPRKTGQ